MFNTWLRQTCDPCWCQVANAFKMVKLNEAAREIKKKIGKCAWIVEVQRYMIWVYRYIAAFVSRYSDILYDTVKCELADFYR